MAVLLQALEFLKKAIGSLIIAGIIFIPVMIIYWKWKDKRIKKNMPVDMNVQVKKFRECERRVQEERQKFRNEREQTNKLVEEYKQRRYLEGNGTRIGNSRSSNKNVSGRGSIEKSREIPKTNSDTSRGTKPNSKINWPSFE